MMPRLYTLLAAGPEPLQPYEQLRNFFRGGASTMNTGGLLAIVAACTMLGIIAWYVDDLWQRRHSRPRHRPRRLFHELCHAHGLSWRQRRLLRTLSRHAALSDPSQLFLQPERFDRKQLPPKLASRAEQYENLRDQLFARQLTGPLLFPKSRKSI